MRQPENQVDMQVDSVETRQSGDVGQGHIHLHAAVEGDKLIKHILNLAHFFGIRADGNNHGRRPALPVLSKIYYQRRKGNVTDFMMTVADRPCTRQTGQVMIIVFVTIEQVVTLLLPAFAGLNYRQNLLLQEMQQLPKQEENR